MDIYSIAILVGIGLIAGILGGLLGIGGSVVMIPAMVFLFGEKKEGREMLLQYQAATMCVNFFLAALSARKHFKAGAVYLKVWKTLLPPAFVGIALGVGLGCIPFFKGDGQRYLRWAFGCLMVYIVIMNVYKMLMPGKSDGDIEEKVVGRSRLRKLAVGSSMGFSAGLFGIGGGAIAVPMMHGMLKMPLKNSIATSSMIITFTSLFGAILKNATLGESGTVTESLSYAICLIPTAMIGGHLGSHLTHTLPLKYVRIAFVLLMCVAAYKMFSA